MDCVITSFGKLMPVSCKCYGVVLPADFITALTQNPYTTATITLSSLMHGALCMVQGMGSARAARCRGFRLATGTLHIIASEDLPASDHTRAMEHTIEQIGALQVSCHMSCTGTLPPSCCQCLLRCVRAGCLRAVVRAVYVHRCHCSNPYLTFYFACMYTHFA